MSEQNPGGSGPEGQPYGGQPSGSQPPGYPYGGPPSQPRNGMGIAALVLGILSIPLLFISLGILGVVLGGLAVIFGIIGVRRSGRREATNSGVAVAGIVTGAIGLVIGVVVGVLAILALNVAGDCLNVGQNASQAEINRCIQDSVNNN